MYAAVVLLLVVGGCVLLLLLLLLLLVVVLVAIACDVGSSGANAWLVRVVVVCTSVASARMGAAGNKVGGGSRVGMM